MAHLIETMAYTAAGGTPWHKLGVAVNADLTPEEMAIAAGINWEVGKIPVYLPWGGKMVKVPGKYSLTRLTDGKVMDIVGSGYTPTQNVEALGFFKRFTEAGGMAMETAGSLAGGQRIWGLAKIGESFTLAGGDRIEGYLLICSPHKQGEALTIKLTAVRVVCNNTLQMSLAGKGADWRMSHWHAFDGDMQQTAAEALNLAKSKLHEIEARARVMAQAQLDEQGLMEFIAKVSGSRIIDAMIATDGSPLPTGSILDHMMDVEAAEAEIAEIRRDMKLGDLNRTGKLILDAMINSPGADMKSAKGTVWGALNGVTYAIDHQIGRTDDSRLTSAWFGVRGQMKKQAEALAFDTATGILAGAAR